MAARALRTSESSHAAAGTLATPAAAASISTSLRPISARPEIIEVEPVVGGLAAMALEAVGIILHPPTHVGFRQRARIAGGRLRALLEMNAIDTVPDEQTGKEDDRHLECCRQHQRP